MWRAMIAWASGASAEEPQKTSMRAAGAAREGPAMDRARTAASTASERSFMAPNDPRLMPTRLPISHPTDRRRLAIYTEARRSDNARVAGREGLAGQGPVATVLKASSTGRARF